MSSVSKEPKRVVYRAPRAIDVVMTVAAITVDHTAVGKRVTAAKGDRSLEKIADGHRIERATASRAAWARRERWCGRPRGRGPCAAPSAAAPCAHAPLSGARRARADPLPLGATPTARSPTPAPSDRSGPEGNTINSPVAYMLVYLHEMESQMRSSSIYTTFEKHWDRNDNSARWAVCLHSINKLKSPW